MCVCVGVFGGGVEGVNEVFGGVVRHVLLHREG